MPKNHDQVEVWAPHKGGLRLTSVDAGMVHLLTELWAEGVSTTGSCEEILPGLARIWFRHGGDKVAFIKSHPGAEDQGSGAVDFPVEYIR